MRNPYEQVRTAAQRFIALYPADLPPPQLAELLGGCAAHLKARFEIENDDAYDVALSAWSERAGRQTRCTFDLDVSTPWLVFIADHQAGVRHAVPIADVLRWMGPRIVTTDGKAAIGG